MTTQTKAKPATKRKHVNILSYDTNAKTVKGRGKGYATAILYLAPSNQSGVMNTCPNASKGCREACLFSAGRGKMPSVIDARVNKTKLLFEDQAFFMECLAKDIEKYERKAKREGLELVVRLNGTSDIAWETIRFPDGKNVFEKFSHIKSYDYTKSFKRMASYLRGEMPSNYSLTFSKSESNDKFVGLVVAMGGNVAIVFEDKPTTFLGKKVVDGDETDLRFLDEKNVIVGLTAKGDAKKDSSGFVVRNEVAN